MVGKGLDGVGGNCMHHCTYLPQQIIHAFTNTCLNKYVPCNQVGKRKHPCKGATVGPTHQHGHVADQCWCQQVYTAIAKGVVEECYARHKGIHVATCVVCVDVYMEGQLRALMLLVLTVLPALSLVPLH